MKKVYKPGNYSFAVSVLKFAKLMAVACLLLLAACSKNSPAPTKTDTGTGTGTGTGTATDTLTASKVAIAALDDEVNAFMSTYNVPAVSVAITKGEKLVYLKAYGTS